MGRFRGILVGRYPDGNDKAESLNSVIRKATKRRKLFPNDDAALKVAFLAIQQASKKWIMPIRDWKPVMTQRNLRLVVVFGDLGLVVRNAYGMTETSASVTITPTQYEGPVDPRYGALSIGVPVFNTHIKIVDDQGREVSVGEEGKLLIKGTQVISGYWRRPEDRSIVDGWISTGDIATIDRDGWVDLTSLRNHPGRHRQARVVAAVCVSLSADV